MGLGVLRSMAEASGVSCETSAEGSPPLPSLWPAARAGPRGAPVALAGRGACGWRSRLRGDPRGARLGPGSHSLCPQVGLPHLLGDGKIGRRAKDSCSCGVVPLEGS